MSIERYGELFLKAEGEDFFKGKWGEFFKTFFEW